MARPLGFDKNEVLNSAMEVFWSDGYEASSIQKLLDSMGINRGSLYASFGDKEELFLLSLDLYELHINKHLDDTLHSSHAENISTQEALRLFLISYFRITQTNINRKGCLLINSICELSIIDKKLAKHVEKRQKKMLKAIENKIKQGQKNGDISSKEKASLLTDTIYSSMCGLAMLAKQGRSKKQLLQVVDFTIEALQ